MNKQRTVIYRCMIAVIAVAVVLIVAFIISSCMSLFANDSSQQNDSQASEASQESNEELQPVAGEPTSITLSFAGDCTLGTDEYFDYDTSFNSAYANAEDPSWFFANVSDIFSADDLTVVNMEGTLTTEQDRADKTYAFKGDAEYAQVLVDGSVEAASLANNHSYDYGTQSYTDTITALEDAGIATFGYDRIAYVDVNDIKVALIGTYELDEGIDIKDSMVENIHSAQNEDAQLIVVFAHWGYEYNYVPDDVQVELAHAAVDAGADLVVGSHPHVLEGYEVYNGRYIVYSLGNFCFGGNSGPEDQDCLIFQQTFTIENGEVEKDNNVNIIPCLISSTSSYNNYQPTPAVGSEKERIEEKIDESNAAIAELSAEVEAGRGQTENS